LNRTAIREGGTTHIGGLPRGIIYATGSLLDLRGPDRVAGAPRPALAHNQQLLITSGSDIVLQRDVTYENYAGSESVLGLFSSGGSVRVGPAAPSDLRLDAFVMAAGPSASFTVDSYASGMPRGTFHLRGGMVSSRYGAFGTFSSSGRQNSGYGRDFQYDRRGFVPPYYPTTNRFTPDMPTARTISWRER